MKEGVAVMAKKRGPKTNVTFWNKACHFEYSELSGGIPPKDVLRFKAHCDDHNYGI